MAQTLATPAFGVALQLGSTDDSGTATYATIAEVSDLNFTLTAQVEDVTAHSTSNPWRTKLSTLLAMTPIEAPVHWIPTAATHNPTTGIAYVWKQRLERAYKILFPNSGPTWSGNAVVENLKFKFPIAGVQESSITLQGSGLWTLA
jgi:predicted secreted protein